MSTVLLVGSGGREHALGKKISASPQVKKLIVVPGNDAMDPTWERWEMPIKTTADFRALAMKAKSKVDCVVVGPDDPLAAGIVDELEASGLRCFGPNAAAARIEASKSFAKEVMKAAKVPTAAYSVAENIEDARTRIKGLDWSASSHGWVLKADGLALGKGVVVCSTLIEAEAALEALKKFGEKQKIVIEERLLGEEISWFAFSDGESCALLDPARDYKRLASFNEGPNTGGMGAISPPPGISSEFRERVRREVFEPTLAEMRKRGTPFRGLLYAGLMVNFKKDQLWVIEFNCRFGDPETQVVLPRMSDDLMDWIDAVCDRKLGTKSKDVGFSKEAAVFVVGAASGYPDAPVKGTAIHGPIDKMICAGVKRGADGKLVTSGGRVFGALGIGASLEAAHEKAYSEFSKISFEGMQYRRDIGSAKTPIVVMASGTGSGFEALARAIDTGELHAEIRALISDKPGAAVLEKARARGIATQVVPYEKGDGALIAALKKLGPHFLVLSGYMRVVSRELIESFRSERGYSRIVNIHPALLPSFPGLHGYRQAYQYGVKLTGATVHLVEEEVDQGPICAQQALPTGSFGLEELEERGKKLEHRLYVGALKWILPEGFAVEKRASANHIGRLCVRKN